MTDKKFCRPSDHVFTVVTSDRGKKLGRRCIRCNYWEKRKNEKVHQTKQTEKRLVDNKSS